MHIAQLKKEVVRQLVITGIIVGVCVVIYGALQYSGDMLDTKYQQLQREVATINANTISFQKKQAEYEEAKKLWQTFSKSQKQRSGIVLGKAQKLLEDMKDQYMLGNFKVDISKPEELADSYKTDTTVVVSTRVDMAFDAMIDENIFAFVGALEKGLPGYIKMDAFQVMREGEMSPLVIKNIEEGKYQPVVQGKLTFFWRDLKDLNQQEQPLAEGGSS